MTDKHRIHGTVAAIRAENTRGFYDARAKAIHDMQNPYVAVLLGDQNPEHAREWNQFEKDRVLPQLKITAESDVLDIGCGIGRWAETLVPMCRSYAGVDFSREMVRIARERNQFPGREYEFYQLSFQEAVSKGPEFYGRQFDRLIIGGVCMYINDNELPACYGGLLRLLAERCLVYLTETVAAQTRLTLDEYPSEALKTTYDVIYRTPAEYNAYYEVLARAGFVIRKQDFLPHLNNERGYHDTERWYTVLER